MRWPRSSRRSSGSTPHAPSHTGTHARGRCGSWPGSREQYEYQALLDESSLLKIPMKLVVHMESAEQRDVRYDVVGLDPLEK